MCKSLSPISTICLILLLFITACGSSGGGSVQPPGGDTNQPGSSLPPTASAPVQSAAAYAAYYFTPGDPASIDASITDDDTRPTGPQGYAASGDNYQVNRYERPFDYFMQYLPDTDIQWAFLSFDQAWFYISIQVAGLNPTTKDLQASYAVEMDTDMDGGGDYIVWADPPYSTTWTKDRVIVERSVQGLVGGPRPLLSDAPWPGGSYDSWLFDGGEGVIPDSTWVRVSPADPTIIQIAFKPELLLWNTNWNMTMLWGVWADAGLRLYGSFDYNDVYTAEQAGSSMPGDPFFPVNTLYALDNTCRAAFGFTPAGNEPGLCGSGQPSSGQTSGGQTGGGQTGGDQNNTLPPDEIPVGVVVTPPPDEQDGEKSGKPSGDTGSITVIVYMDENLDGTHELEEPTVSDYVVTLLDLTCASPILTLAPDNGMVVFTGLGAGDYCLSLDYTGTVVPSNPQPSTAIAGEGTLALFGIQQQGEDTVTAQPTFPVTPQPTVAQGWQNPANQFDVNNDGAVTPIDVLMLTNYLNEHGAGALPSPRPDGSPYYDVNGDGAVTPIDPLQVINYLNSSVPPTPTPTATASGIITGYVCMDSNSNGACDPGEAPYAGMPINLDLGATNVANTTTDASGNFRFEGLASEVYQVSGYWGGTMVNLSGGSTVNLTIASP